MDQILLTHSLNIDQKYESFINNFCSTTGTSFPQGKLGNYLASWYEGYLFCLLIGLNTNNRHYKGYEKKYQKMNYWSTPNIDQYKYCIARVLSREDIVKELSLDSREGIKKSFKSTEDLLKKVKEICEEFSLGGLHYLIKLYENDNTIFNDPLALKTIYEKTLKS